ncbi:MAG: F0F1 ATP synthase subunit alpha, partial [Bacillota bacterium]|nr:F0F1 ATP synthase subunit alpha [Bacillota bacterium]
SITDGQIYLQSDLFYAGVRPAISVGLSVSRVGGSAQSQAMRRVAGQLRLDLARYRELAAFAQFGADLDRRTRARLTRGSRLVELLKQKQYRTLSLDEMVVSLYSGIQGYLDEIPVELVDRFATRLREVIRLEHPDLGKRIRESGDLTDSDEQTLRRIIEDLLAQFKIEQGIGA